MPFIAPELIIQAKQMDLLTYLKNYEPYELVKFSGNTYCTRTHDSLKISNGKWIWWSRGIGGRSALDYLIKAAVATQRMKQAYIATKEKAERSVNANSSSAEEYASDKLESGIDEVVHDGAYAFDKAGRKGLEETVKTIL